MLHLLRAHLQVMLWKVADHQTPPDECSNITNFGRKIVDGIPVPVTGAIESAPPQRIYAIRCQCNATVPPSRFIPVLPPVHQPGGTWMNLVSTGMNRDEP